MHFPDSPSDSAAKDFVRLKDKESVVGVFRGEPRIYYSHWVGKGSVPCKGIGSCELCSSGNRGKFRFRLNFATGNEGGMSMLIYEGGKQIYDQLKTLSEDYSLETHMVRVSRKGASQNDTEYTVTPLPNGALTGERLAKVEALPMKDLTPQAPKEVPPGPLAKTGTDGDIPF